MTEASVTGEWRPGPYSIGQEYRAVQVELPDGSKRFVFPIHINQQAIDWSQQALRWRTIGAPDRRLKELVDLYYQLGGDAA